METTNATWASNPSFSQFSCTYDTHYNAFPSEYLHVKFYLGKKTCLVKGKGTNLKNNYLNYLFSHYLASNDQ